MAANVSPSEVDFACPVCCDIFRDPVVLLCGHSFCKHCLQEWWRQSALQSCPVCKGLFPLEQPPLNLALRNLCDNLRQEKSQRPKSGSKDLICSLHSEKLKLFCQDDRKLICVICRDSQKHKKHNCIPINEAAEPYRAHLSRKVMNLKTKQGSLKEEKLKCDKMANHIKLQAQQTEKTIKEEFQKLYQFLRAEETARIDAVRIEAALKSEAMDIRIVNLTAEISSLTDKLKTLEMDIKAEDMTFMLNVKSTMERSQFNLPDPETPLGALLDEAKHTGNLLFTVWKKMKDILQHTPVTLDPNTGGSLLIISEHMTRSTTIDKCQTLPKNPERLSSFNVLGSEGFSRGKHSWDVEVEGYWAVGVAVKDNLHRKIWAIYMCACTGILRELTPDDYVKVVSEDSFPKRVRVQLDCDHGILAFFDLDRKKPVHTIKYTFTGTVFPYFQDNVKILPSEWSVVQRRPN
ncbi:zinc-binding protein A33-like isoform X1 [Notothenia coriiceps]|uniref:Zinc-binding protein A33-like isoform X1 n=1 Tax=Notothenia coriiceps TaxID=8208 RepID=A0A6I9PAA6_9TELE|nr:PREDICTED: zinc-binding protein A33-like isoform X1 [Notothenia coriiceps]